MTQRDYKVHGLDCAEEVLALKREVGPRVGGEQNLSFDILQGKMAVLADAQDVPDEQILAAVRRSGLRAEPWQAERDRDQPRFIHRHGRAMLTIVSGVLLAAAFVVHAVLTGSVIDALAGEAMPVASLVLYGVSIAAGVFFVLPKAIAAARALRPDMNLLMTIAVAGAILIGEYFEAATVAFLFAVSLLLESWSVGRARQAVQGLLEAAPPIARVRRGDAEVEVHPDEVEVGQVVIVRPGEKVPLDGQVVAGRSDVDQAPITGESVPVAKQAGDDVFAGTINGDGLLEVRTTRPAEQSTLASIIRLVTQAQSRRAPSEQWVERFARIYTPIVLVLALAIFILPPLVAGGAWAEWFYRALVLLVIACPCALVISTPVSIVAALTRSAHNGVLVKGGLFMEAPARITAVAFDKTGTLTEGRPRVTRLIPLNEHSEADLLARAAALEAGSNHPLAQAIRAEAERRGVVVPALSEHQAVAGRGVTGRIDGRAYWLGSHRYLEERGQETPAVHEQLEALSDAGHSVVAVGTEDHVCGLIALADEPRPQARQVVADLHAMGISPVAMLTGDNAATARRVADTLGIDDVHAELLPADKVAAVERLVAEHGRVAMVGDGVNDAPALAASSLGIAMGAAGSDAAIETADVALMADDLGRLPWLFRHARRTLNIIRQNIALALAIKLLFLGLTVFGLATLWAAIAADMGASLLVIFNGLRLLRDRG